ncbi:MAG: nucleotidyltransferase family protein [Archangium sp.]
MRPLFEVLRRAPAWETTAVRHGLAVWVADELADSKQPVPLEILDAARRQLAEGLKVKRLTLKTLEALNAVGITPVLLKGYGLATRLFPQQPLARPSVDVDLLVEPDHVPTAERAILSLGLHPSQVPGVHDVDEEHFHHAYSGHAGLVELHFRLTNSLGRGKFDDTAVLSRARVGELDGRRVRWLNREDEFLYLALHAANHGFLRLSWLVDLAKYLEREPSIDFAAMRERATDAGFLVPVSTALGLVESLLVHPLPEGAHEFRRGRRRRFVDSHVFSLERVTDARWSHDRLASFLLRLYLVDSAGRGARHVFDGALRFMRQWRGS